MRHVVLCITHRIEHALPSDCKVGPVAPRLPQVLDRLRGGEARAGGGGGTPGHAGRQGLRHRLPGEQGVDEPGGEDVAGAGGVDRGRPRGRGSPSARRPRPPRPRGGPWSSPPTRRSEPATPSPASHGSATKAGGRSDSEPTRTWAGRAARARGGHVGHDPGAVGRRSAISVGQLEARGCGRRARPSRARRRGPEARLPAAVHVHDGALALGVDENDRAGALALDADDARGVDARLLELAEQPVSPRVGPEGRDDDDVVSGAGQGDRGVGPAPAEADARGARRRGGLPRAGGGAG